MPQIELHPTVSLTAALARSLGAPAARAITDGPTSRGSGHALRFAHCQSFQSSGAQIYFGKQDYMIVTLPGHACGYLRERDLLAHVVRLTADTTSRVDIAVDLETDATPYEVAEPGMADRTVGVMNSRTGQTVYLGSRKSDRTMRVYRYAEPHERSHLVRCEVEMKGKLAQRAALALVDSSLDAVARGELERFALDEVASLIQGPVASVTMPPRALRTDEGTLLWLKTQVAPACQRLLDAGRCTRQELLSILLPDE